MATLKINRGTTYTIQVNYQRNGEAASLVGSTVRFTMKDKEFDADINDDSAAVKKDVTDGNAQGEAVITIDPADTATLEPQTYFYDLRVHNSDGSVYKLDEGKVKLDGSPTNRLN